MSEAASTPANVGSVRYETLPWLVAIERFEEQWSAIIRRNGLNPSLHPRWTNAIATSVDKAAAIRVQVGFDKDKLTSATPYFVSDRRMYGIPVACLELASNLMSYHADIVTEADPRDTLEAFLAQAGRWHVLHAANLVPDGSAAKAIESVAERIGGRLYVQPVDTSPFLPISGDFDSFLAAKNKKFRYKYRQRLRFLEDNPDHTMQWFVQVADVERLLADILQIEARSWKATSNVDISGNAAEKRYYEFLLPFLAEQGGLMANVFYVKDQPVAYNLCCNRDGWVGQLKTSFDEAYKPLSPGSIVIDAAIKAAFDAEATEFDFLGHADQHKLSWSKHTRDHVDMYLFGPALRSRLLGWLKTLRRRI